MKLTLVRNATMRLAYGGHLLLTDPFLAERHALRSFAGISPNPTVGLPLAPAAVVAGVEMVLISHLHSDHFDEAAQALLDKELPLFCQPGDEAQIIASGFRSVTAVADEVKWQGITIRRAPGRHGLGALGEQMGPVSGFILAAAGEPTLYWLGDTVWYDEVAAVVAAVKPDVIVTHSSGARFGDGELIVMDGAQTAALCLAAPRATVVAVHMESLDHGTVSRADLRAAASAAGVAEAQLRIPADGETLTF